MLPLFLVLRAARARQHATSASSSRASPASSASSSSASTRSAIPGRAARRGARRRRGRVPHLLVDRAAPPPADPRHARRLHLPGDLERLHVAARRAADEARYTLPVALANLVGEHVQDTELMMAGAVLTVLPVLLLFLASSATTSRASCGEREGMSARRARAASARASSRCSPRLRVLRRRAGATRVDARRRLRGRRRGWTRASAPTASRWRSRPDAGPHRQRHAPRLRLRGGGGYVVARKTVRPRRCRRTTRFTFQLRGEAPPNNLEFKLIDPSRRERLVAVPARLRSSRATGRRSRSRSARSRSPGGRWAAASSATSRRSRSRSPRGAAAAGTVWIDDLDARRAAAARRGAAVPPTVAGVVGAAGITSRARVLDGDSDDGWRRRAGDRAAVDRARFRRNREYGGLVIDWDARRLRERLRVAVSNDGRDVDASCTTVRGGNGGRDYVYLPGSESPAPCASTLRRSPRAGYGIAASPCKPLAFSAIAERVLRGHRARRAARAPIPRHLRRADYWTVVGVDRRRPRGAAQRGGHARDRQGRVLDRAVPADRRRRSSPGATSQTTQRLAERRTCRSRPSPGARDGARRSTVTAFAAGEPGASIGRRPLRAREPRATARQPRARSSSPCGRSR